MIKNRYIKREPKIHPSAWGTWRVQYFDQDLDEYREKVVSTKADAENLKRTMVHEDDLSPWFPDKKKPELIKAFKALAEKWLDHAEHVRRISISCLMNYRGHLRNHILPVMGEIPLRKLRSDHIKELTKILKTKKAKKTP